jgi:hypothetical protein
MNNNHNVIYPYCPLAGIRLTEAAMALGTIVFGFWTCPQAYSEPVSPSPIRKLVIDCVMF